MIFQEAILQKILGRVVEFYLQGKLKPTLFESRFGFYGRVGL